MKVSLKYYIKKRLFNLLLVFLLTNLYIVFIWLYGISFDDVSYVLLLSLMLITSILSLDFYYHQKEQKALFDALNYAAKTQKIDGIDNLDEHYQLLIEEILKLHIDTKHNYEMRLDDIQDYYSLWIHQIKVPIAAMDLILQNSQHPSSLQLSNELIKICQYVDMVLNYLRLESYSNDLVIKEVSLDPIIRSVIHKLAPLFIQKKLTLDYKEVNAIVLSDEKWLAFVLEQLLSNAIKYTPKGCITISYQAPFLTIKDTGVGIEASDLPRIFEKGYTGYNGRIHDRASGLGLYLTKKTLDLLRHPIKVESTLSQGTTITLDLSQTKRHLD